MDETTDERRQVALQTDREDLLAVLSMRFGPVPEDIQRRIASATDVSALERLILVAANAPDWEIFVEELDAGSRAFRLTGQRYDPLAGSTTARAASSDGVASGDEEAP